MKRIRRRGEEEMLAVYKAMVTEMWDDINRRNLEVKIEDYFRRFHVSPFKQKYLIPILCATTPPSDADILNLRERVKQRLRELKTGEPQKTTSSLEEMAKTLVENGWKVYRPKVQYELFTCEG